MNQKAKISFIIPCYNSAMTIRDVVNELVCMMQEVKKYEYEVILISDKSPDLVFEVIKEMAQENSNIIGINLAKNFGQHAALMAGYQYCIGDIVVSLDDDGQTPGKESINLIRKIEEGYDVVYASYYDKKHNLARNLGSKLNDFMAEHLIDKPKNLKVSSFFAAKRSVILELIKYDKPYPYLLGLVLRTTANITNVNVTHRVREIGKSNYTLRKLLSLWLNGFTAFSVKPLRIATVIGFAVAFIGFSFGIYTIVNKLMYPQILAGYSSIMSVILFTSGMIMLMLGLIGEYIGRIYISINNSPQYVIREKINIEENRDE